MEVSNAVVVSKCRLWAKDESMKEESVEKREASKWTGERGFFNPYIFANI